ncbi:hypothetical protein [Gulosibacter molinativorax]|uniref:hypothetical protein n=1 Tax=Gulosibacter molinativorax TaxID=256821 RepID=UPI0015E68B28|nr:hypothetical protein [Gulosibacter molinativorax]
MRTIIRHDPGKVPVSSWGSGARLAGGWRLAAGGWRLAAGGWRLAAGGWRLAAGGWRLVDLAREALRTPNVKPCPDFG